ncbi:MAG: DUF2975 domain-containing protein [Terricaulis sp.]
MRALGKGSVASIAKVGLAVTWWALWLALGALLLAALGYAALLGLVSAGMIDANVLTGGEGQFQVGTGNGDFDLTYDQPGGATWPVVAPALMIGAVALGGGLIIVGRLRRLFDSFTSGEPFRRENANHLRVIWIAMLVIEIARYVLLGVVSAIFATVGTPDGAKANFDVNIDLSTWMSILILIVLAEVFREGARLKEEQELTI